MVFVNKLINVIYSYFNDPMKYLKVLNINHKFVLLFFVIVLINYINTGIIFSKDNQNEDKTYYLKNDNYQNIPRSYFEFLENKDHNLTIKKLKNSSRIEEIASMISGENITESAINQAQELLK